MPEDHLMDTYNRLPVAFASGEGCWLTDTEGGRYLDAVAGIAVCGLGHAHPAVTQAVCEQAGQLVHTSNLYRVPLQEEVAGILARLSGLERVFFANSGAEANEGALKIARRYGHEQGVERPEVVVMQGGFHGRTLATLTATGNRKVQAGFEPLMPGFKRVPYDDLQAVEQVARSRPRVVAVLVEPVQGENGVVVPGEDYLPGLRRLCDERGWLLMVDEIQTGLGRTGAWFAYQHAGIAPDVVTLAKALGNGVPVGAVLAGGEAARALGPGSHGTTFGGGPLPGPCSPPWRPRAWWGMPDPWATTCSGGCGRSWASCNACSRCAEWALWWAWCWTAIPKICRGAPWSTGCCSMWPVATSFVCYRR